MKRLVVLAAALVLAPLGALANDPELFHLSVKDVPVENGKILDMAFQEIERNADSSTIEITRRSGGSVSSSMFIVRGLCGLARSRNAQYVVATRIAGEAERYTVTFPQQAPEPGKGFTMTQCDLMRY